MCQQEENAQRRERAGHPPGDHLPDPDDVGNVYTDLVANFGSPAADPNPAQDPQQDAESIEPTPSPVNPTLELSPSGQMLVGVDFEAVSDIPDGTTSAFAFGILVTWQVTDQAGDPLPFAGMSVSEEGTTVTVAPGAFGFSEPFGGTIAVTDYLGQYTDPIGLATNTPSTTSQISQSTFVNGNPVGFQAYTVYMGATPSSPMWIVGTSTNGGGLSFGAGSMCGMCGP